MVGMVGMVGMAMFGDAMISCHEIVLRTHSLHQIYRAVAAFAAEDDRAKVDGILRLDLKPLFPSFSNKGITTCSHIFICFPFFLSFLVARTRHGSLFILESQDGQGHDRSLPKIYNQIYNICISVYIYIYSSIFQVPTNHFLIVPRNL